MIIVVTLKCTICQRRRSGFAVFSTQPTLFPPFVSPRKFADGNFEAAQRNHSTSGTLFIARAPATSGNCGGPSETNHNDRAECSYWPAEARPSTHPAANARTTVAGPCGRTPDSNDATSRPRAKSTWGSGRGSSCSSRRSTRRWWTPGVGQSTARSSVGTETGATSTG